MNPQWNGYGYAATKKMTQSTVVGEVWNHSCEWLIPGGREKEVTPLSVIWHYPLSYLIP